MVDFENQKRKRCRHCKMNLPTPTSNEREAFCTRGCYRSFSPDGGLPDIPYAKVWTDGDCGSAQKRSQYQFQLSKINSQSPRRS